MEWPTTYTEILARIDAVNPVQYARTRNHVNGAVSHLSPYITRGVVTLPFVRDRVLAQVQNPKQAEKFIQELAWREFFQNVWQARDQDIFKDLRFEQQPVVSPHIPQAILDSQTGSNAIDAGIQKLISTGYIHNHERMWLASIIANLAQRHWWQPSQWMYYYLLDGDLASNSLSWQWVAGTFSSKKYTCNQELINALTSSDQHDTFLSFDRDTFLDQELPNVLRPDGSWNPSTSLPQTSLPTLDHNQPLHLYHSWNLDPTWRSDIRANRVLVLEPDHYDHYPVAPHVIDFIIELAERNLPNVQIWTGDVRAVVDQYQGSSVAYREYPAVAHWPGHKDSLPKLYPEVSGYFKNFFSFWKACQKSTKAKNL